MRKPSKRHRVCPKGVPDECMYCIQPRGKVWEVLDPKGMGIDEASTEKEAMEIADSNISVCTASSSGYGGRKKPGGPVKTDFNPKGGPFSWH